jgi:uncharacterized oligopeptide transporter (OPT) family protein
MGNVIAGGVAEAAAQQAGDLMQDLKMGLLVGAPLPAQFTGQVIGSLVSVGVSVLAFSAFDAVYGIPSPSLPAPTAAVWASMAQLMGSTGALPPHVAPFMAVGAAAALAVALAAPRLPPATRAWLPSPTAFSVGMYVTANWTLPRVAGALLGARLTARGARESTVVMVATGLVLGEGVVALAAAALAAAGARPITCWGCQPNLCGNFC